MSTFISTIRESKCENLHKLFRCDGEKYLCFTSLSSSWTISVTDGVTLWKINLDEDETDTLRDLAGINNTEAYLSRFRNGINSGDISADVVGSKVTLSVGKGSSALEFDLFEPTAAEKKSEMQTILFRLAESASSLASDLDKANQTIDALKAQKGGAQPSAFMDLGPKKGQNAAKNKPKKVGMSVLNPSSKKRKAAHGVVFD